MRLLGLLLAFASVVSGAAQEPRSKGGLDGVVLQLGGKPLDGATVYAYMATDMLHPFKVMTSADGTFSFRDLNPDGYYLQASKESDGYPYNFFSFYLMPGQTFPKVQVTAGEVAQHVVVQLGMKAAYLRLQITSGGDNPGAAGLIFTRPDLPGSYQRSAKDGDLIPVPPVPFTLRVEKSGWVPWIYNSLEGKSLIALKPGEMLTVNVALQPAH